MRDAASAVLTQRVAKDAGFTRGTLASILLHAALVVSVSRGGAGAAPARGSGRGDRAVRGRRQPRRQPEALQREPPRPAEAFLFRDPTRGSFPSGARARARGTGLYRRHPVRRGNGIRPRRERRTGRPGHGRRRLVPRERPPARPRRMDAARRHQRAGRDRVHDPRGWRGHRCSRLRIEREHADRPRGPTRDSRRGAFQSTRRSAPAGPDRRPRRLSSVAVRDRCRWA